MLKPSSLTLSSQMPAWHAVLHICLTLLYGAVAHAIGHIAWCMDFRCHCRGPMLTLASALNGCSLYLGGRALSLA
eukprot:11605035-Karenia_brevis.AAC.1